MFMSTDVHRSSPRRRASCLITINSIMLSTLQGGHLGINDSDDVLLVIGTVDAKEENTLAYNESSDMSRRIYIEEATKWSKVKKN